MKKFETPEMEIIRFAVEDILAASNEFPVTPLVEDELGITKLG